jgi:hypothetical protein
MKALVALICAVIFGAALGIGALVVADDRVIPCDARRGPDALLGDQVSHVDGPLGGGGCTVPTAGAWITAAVAIVAPVLVVAVVLAHHRRAAPR